MWQGASGAAGMGGGGAMSEKLRERERESEKEGGFVCVFEFVCVCVCVERERDWVEREGGKCKPVTASLLLTAPGLRDSSSPRFPRCRFNSFPSAQSSFFFPLAFYLLLLTDAFISYCM